MSRVINRQRCFTIPQDRLDLFLVQLNMLSGAVLQLEAAYIFQKDGLYDVIVNYYGSYPYQETKLIEFINKITPFKVED